MKTSDQWEHVQRGTYKFLPSRTLGVCVDFYNRKWWVCCMPGEGCSASGPFKSKSDAMAWTEAKWQQIITN